MSEPLPQTLLDEMGKLDASGRAVMRRIIRKHISKAMRQLNRFQPPARRAYLRSYVDEARKALKVVEAESDGRTAVEAGSER